MGLSVAGTSHHVRDIQFKKEEKNVGFNIITVMKPTFDIIQYMTT